MSAKTLLTLSASVLFGTVIAAPNAALAQFGPPPGPPPMLAGPPPGLGAGPPPLGLERGGQANFRGLEGRAAAYSANSYTRNGYTSSGYGRGYRHWPYAAAAAAAYAYGGSYASSDDGCYYASTYRRYTTRRVLVCHEN
jgi:hypothetical protein